MRTARRRAESEGLTITSLMDAMTIILCFLLKSYQASDVTIAASDDLSLPSSTALPTVGTAVQIVLSRTGLVVDGERLADVVEEVGDDGEATWRFAEDAVDGDLVRPLHIHLQDARAQTRSIADLVEDDVGFEGRVLLQVDRRIPFHVVRQAMFTAGQAGFGEIQFVVIRS